ncbi:MAG TPA: pyrroloquinoline quinone biosynthesis protein PqqB [Gemmatimonadales bacterium]|nr:pyrroloquinoline quinone biosynthesis protein PqqB [Gemmatimonadales bacterium]
MRVRILGSAAGGGVPQWNCGCAHCQAARTSGRSRTQSSVAVSGDGERWILLNASPDVRQQLQAHPSLWPRGARHTSIAAVVLTDAEIDHTLGLMLLREATQPIQVYAPAGVIGLLTREWPLFTVLGAYGGVSACGLPEGVRTALQDSEGGSAGLWCTAVALSRRAPRYARERPTESWEVGLRIEDRAESGGPVLAYIPAAGCIDERVERIARAADLLLFDGTFWSDAELARATGHRDGATARAMGHLPLGGPDGSLAALAKLQAKRTVFVHINNTNPILDPGSSERGQVERAGMTVGEDGMEFEL